MKLMEWSKVSNTQMVIQLDTQIFGIINIVELPEGIRIQRHLIDLEKYNEDEKRMAAALYGYTFFNRILTDQEGNAVNADIVNQILAEFISETETPYSYLDVENINAAEDFFRKEYFISEAFKLFDPIYPAGTIISNVPRFVH